MVAGLVQKRLTRTVRATVQTADDPKRGPPHTASSPHAITEHHLRHSIEPAETPESTCPSAGSLRERHVRHHQHHRGYAISCSWQEQRNQEDRREQTPSTKQRFLGTKKKGVRRACANRSPKSNTGAQPARLEHHAYPQPQNHDQNREGDANKHPRATSAWLRRHQHLGNLHVPAHAPVVSRGFSLV